MMIPPSIPRHSSAPNPIVALGLVASGALEDTHGNQTFHRFSVPLRTSQLVPQGRCPPGPPCDADLLCPQASFRGCPNPIVVLGLVASGLFEDTHGHQPFHRFSLLLRTSWLVLWGLCPARGQHQGHHIMLPHPFLCILWRPPQPYCGFGIGHIWALRGHSWPPALPQVLSLAEDNPSGPMGNVSSHGTALGPSSPYLVGEAEGLRQLADLPQSVEVFIQAADAFLDALPVGGLRGTCVGTPTWH